jgi:hypothetical protein
MRLDLALDQRRSDRMLTGGFYAEVNLTYDPSIAEETAGRPFGIESLREIQLSKIKERCAGHPVPREIAFHIQGMKGSADSQGWAGTVDS